MIPHCRVGDLRLLLPTYSQMFDRRYRLSDLNRCCDVDHLELPEILRNFSPLKFV